MAARHFPVFLTSVNLILMLAAPAAPALTEGPYTYEIVNSEATITEFDRYFSGTLAITNTLGGCPVTTISESAFREHAISAVIIPETVASIGPGPFIDCYNLTNISVKAENPSYSATNGVLFNKNYTVLIQYPPGLKGGYEVPDGVAEINQDAFQACDNLTEVSMPSTVTNIGDCAFWACFALTNVTFSSGLIRIGDLAFGLTGMTLLNIPDTVADIGEQAFYSCWDLVNVMIGKGVTNIENFVFCQCYSLSNFTVATDNQVFMSLDGVLINKVNGTLVQYPIGLTANQYSIPEEIFAVGPSAFEACENLISITFPNNLRLIGAYAFANCGVQEISIPDNVTRIGLEAFWNCYSLTKVIIGGGVTNIGSGTFDLCFSLSNVYFEGNAPTLSGSTVFASCPATVYYLPAFASNWPSTFAGRPTLCWNPTVQRDAAFGFASGRFSFNIAGTTNIPIVVQATTNLSSGVWTPVTNATLNASGSLSFADPASTNSPARFYRIVWP